jgi:PAS domain S-box-containing protein
MGADPLPSRVLVLGGTDEQFAAVYSAAERQGLGCERAQDARTAEASLASSSAELFLAAALLPNFAAEGARIAKELWRANSRLRVLVVGDTRDWDLLHRNLGLDPRLVLLRSPLDERELCQALSVLCAAETSSGASDGGQDAGASIQALDRLRLLNAAFENTRAGITIKDPENRILYANPAEAAMHGYEVGELLGKNASLLGVPAAAKPMNKEDLKAFEATPHETFNLRKDGTVFPVRLTSDVVKDDENEPIGVVTVCEDVSAARAAEEAVRRSEARLRSLVERLPDAVAVFRHGQVRFVNDTMVAYLGFASSADMLHRPLLELVHPDHGEWLAQTRLPAPPGRRFMTDFRFTRADGEQVVADVCLLPIEYDDESAHMIIARDVGEIVQLRRSLRRERRFWGIVGESQEMQQVYALARQVGPTDAAVLITGETGTGKELLARAIHSESLRASGPFVAVNCGALPDGLVESELFGHQRGAFSGAVKDRRGRFERAAGGTIFLDEVVELSLAAQVKLLRVLEEKRVEPVGGEASVHVDVRVVSATNSDLRERVSAGTFRSDLFFRLCVVPLHLPPLRQRGADIILLAEAYLATLSEEAGLAAPVLSDSAKRALLDWRWPGNVRELINTLRFALVRSGGRTIELEDLPPNIGATRVHRPTTTRGRKRKLSFDAVERALRRAGGNKSQAAKALGVGRGTLYRYLSRGSQS